MKKSKRFCQGAIAALLLGLAALSANPAAAAGRREISDREFATSVPNIDISSGQNVVISFDNDRYIQTIWIDDPALLGVATDRPLCSGGSSRGQGCGFAQTLRFTRLSGGLDLPGASFGTHNGRATMVTILTTDANGRDRQSYQVQVTAIDGGEVPSLVSITTGRQETTEARIDRFRQQTFSIEKIARGRNVALEQGMADIQSEAWQRLESFMALVERGTSTREALGESGVDARLLFELEKLGSSEQIVGI